MKTGTLSMGMNKHPHLFLFFRSNFIGIRDSNSRFQSWPITPILKKQSHSHHCNIINTGLHDGVLMEFWTIKCEYCGKVFTSDVKERAENDLIIHHQDVHRGKSLDQGRVEAKWCQ